MTIDERIIKLLDEMEANSKKYKETIEKYEKELAEKNKKYIEYESKISELEKQYEDAVKKINSISNGFKKYVQEVNLLEYEKDTRKVTSANQAEIKINKTAQIGNVIVIYNTETEKEETHLLVPSENGKIASIIAPFVDKVIGTEQKINNVVYKLVEVKNND